MSSQESSESRNEIIVQVKKVSGVGLESGSFISADPKLVEKVNLALKDHQAEVRKIGSLKDQNKTTEDTPISGYYQIYVFGSPTELLTLLTNQSWIESAYSKPKSEDPGNF